MAIYADVSKITIKYERGLFENRWLEAPIINGNGTMAILGYATSIPSLTMLKKRIEDEAKQRKAEGKVVPELGRLPVEVTPWRLPG